MSLRLSFPIDGTIFNNGFRFLLSYDRNYVFAISDIWIFPQGVIEISFFIHSIIALYWTITRPITCRILLMPSGYLCEVLISNNLSVLIIALSRTPRVSIMLQFGQMHSYPINISAAYIAMCLLINTIIRLILHEWSYYIPHIPKLS